MSIDNLSNPQKKELLRLVNGAEREFNKIWPKLKKFGIPKSALHASITDLPREHTYVEQAIDTIEGAFADAKSGLKETNNGSV